MSADFGAKLAELTAAVERGTGTRWLSKAVDSHKAKVDSRCYIVVVIKNLCEKFYKP